MKKKICMVVQDPLVKGGIAAVVNGYRGSKLEENYNIIYVESYKDGTKFAKFLKGISGYFRFIKVLLIEKPNLIHIHSSFGPSFFRKLPFIYMADYANVPIINHIHGSEFDKFYFNAKPNKKKLIKKVYGKCEKIIALSDEWKELFGLIYPIENIEVIENFSTITKDVVRDECNRQILFLGAINKMKGCYDIPDVVEYVVKEIPDCKFVIAGDGEINELKKIFREKKLENNVIFPGWVRNAEKDKLLRESDVFFLPSYTEGMPMSILDAMGYGLPIITTKVGSIPKIVHHDKNGFMYNPGDIFGFSEGILKLLKNKDLMNEFGDSSYNLVKRKYSIETHIEKIKNVYNRFW